MTRPAPATAAADTIPLTEDWRVRIRSPRSVWVSPALSAAAAEQLRADIRRQLVALADGPGLLQLFPIRDDGSAADIRARSVEAVELLGPHAGPGRRTDQSPRRGEPLAAPREGPAPLAGTAFLRSLTTRAPADPTRGGRRWA